MQSGEWPRGRAPPCMRRQLTAPGDGSDVAGEDRRGKNMLSQPGERGGCGGSTGGAERSGVSLYITD